MSSSADTAKNFQRQTVMFPFANPGYAEVNPPLQIVRSDGVHVFDALDRKYLDVQAGLWNVNAGHNRAEIKKAIADQMDRISYYSLFNGTTNPPAQELAGLVAELGATEGIRKLFYTSGGSEANDAAIKIARQYWALADQPRKRKIISLRRAYHGVTFGALSASGLGYNRSGFEPLLPDFHQVETPFLYRNPFTEDAQELGRICATLLEREIEYHGAGNVAAFLAEPVQGAGGVIVPPSNYWPLVRAICDRHNVLLIADEVVTGFGRLGSMFGSRHWNVRPDMMVFAKGINSGYVPLGAVAIGEKVEAAWLAHGEAPGGRAMFFHGMTYSGHPLACAAAIANLGIVRDEGLAENAGRVGEYLLAALKRIAEERRNIGDVRGVGLMIGMELVKEKPGKVPFAPEAMFGSKVADLCRRQGVIVRSSGDTMIISPPLIFTRADADTFVTAIDAALDQLERSGL